MFSKTTLLALTAASAVAAQRPNDTSICDYYTTALLTNNTAANQYTVLTLVVNTVVIGNYTQPNVGIAVPGILAAGTYNGNAVNLLPYFNGALASSNRGGSAGVSVNFLDGGGAAPLLLNMPSEDSTSNQYFLLTHLYQFFGSLLGCSEYGMPGFAAYDGFPSMAGVHKFMDLDENEVGYFIQQVGLAAESFGVTPADATAVGMSLQSLFGYRCAPNATVIAAQGPALQSICLAETCPIAEGAVCDQYPSVSEPLNASSSAAPFGNSTTTASGTGAAAAGTSTETETFTTTCTTGTGASAAPETATYTETSTFTGAAAASAASTATGASAAAGTSAASGTSTETAASSASTAPITAGASYAGASLGAVLAAMGFAVMLL